MADNDFWDKTKRLEVYYAWGIFPGDGGSKRFMKAPLDILKTPFGQFVCPDNPALATGSSAQSSALTSDDVNDAFYGSRNELYSNGERIVIGEHEMGDYNGTAGEIWIGVHKFGPVL
jgi:hypothetical protein